MELHERWLRNALDYCCAAIELNDTDSSENTSSRIAPSALCLGFGVELFLKSVLLRSGRSEKELRTTFGHDLMKLWSTDECARLRQQAGERAEHLHNSLQRRYGPNELPVPGTFEVNFKYVSKLHDKASGMALRYPTGSTFVPQIRLLAAVFESLIEAERNDRL